VQANRGIYKRLGRSPFPIAPGTRVAPWRVVSISLDPFGHSVPAGDINRVRWIVLDDLRKAEGDLAQMQQVEPDPERARHLSAVRMAIVKLETLVAPLPEN
jgi:hypothetical protein